MMRKRDGFFKIICLLALVFVLTTGYDIWEVATGNVDINKHLPFLMSVYLGIMIGIVYVTKRHVDAEHRLKKSPSKR